MSTSDHDPEYVRDVERFTHAQADLHRRLDARMVARSRAACWAELEEYERRTLECDAADRRDGRAADGDAFRAIVIAAAAITAYGALLSLVGWI